MSMQLDKPAQVLPLDDFPSQREQWQQQNK